MADERNTTDNTIGVDKIMVAKHSDDEDEIEQPIEETYLEDEPEENPLKDKRRALRNEAWDYFDITDLDQKMATCRLCHEEFSFRTTSSNLARHLKRKHFLEFKEELDDDAKRRKNKQSRSWDYFIISDPERRIATCKVCNSQCSYMSTVSNLMKHVQRKHGLLARVSDDEEQPACETDEELEPLCDSSLRRSSVWLYFKCVDKVGRIARCLICQKRLSHLTSITNLKRHLHRKHPHVSLDSSVDGKKMLISSNGQLYEIEENVNCPKQSRSEVDDDGENAEPMEIYLDEVEGNVIESKQKSKSHKQKKSKSKIVLQEPHDSHSSDDESTLQKRYVRKKNDDSIEQFGKYLVTLLKQLPKETSNNLQAEFVKQVMIAQRYGEKIPNNGYAITITQQPNQIITDARNEEVFVAVPQMQAQ